MTSSSGNSCCSLGNIILYDVSAGEKVVVFSYFKYDIPVEKYHKKEFSNTRIIS